MKLINVNSNALLEQLNEFMLDSVKANSLNTTDAHKADLKAYQEYCTTMDVVGFPATGESIASFIRWMKAKGWAWYTIRRRVSTVSVYHKAVNLPDPAHDGLKVSNALKEIKKKCAEPKQAPALRRKDLNNILLEIKAEKYETLRLRNKALILLAVDSMMRRSELANVKLSHFEENEDGTGYIVQVPHGDRHGKTVDITNKSYRFVTKATYDAIVEMVDYMGLAEGGYIFRKVKCSTVGDKLKEQDPYVIMKRYGYTGHSARVGSAMDQRAAGLSTLEIQQSGGWASERMVVRYTQKMDVMESGTAKLAMAE